MGIQFKSSTSNRQQIPTRNIFIISLKEELYIKTEKN